MKVAAFSAGAAALVALGTLLLESKPPVASNPALARETVERVKPPTSDDLLDAPDLNVLTAVAPSEKKSRTDADAVELPSEPDAAAKNALAKRALYWMTFDETDASSIRQRVTAPFPEAERAGLDKAALATVEKLEAASAENLEMLASELEERMRQAYNDYYGGVRFPIRHVSGPKLEDRPKNGSAYSTYVVTNIGDWQCDLGFRSKDYPMVETLLREANHMRAERNREIRMAVAR